MKKLCILGMTLMLWLHENEFSPEDASCKNSQQAKNNQWNFQRLE